MSYELKITRVENGYLLEGIFLESEEASFFVLEDEKDEMRSGEKLLWEVIEYFGLSGSRYDKERLRITREQGDKYADNDSTS